MTISIRVAVAGAFLSGLSLVAAMPVQAVTTGPTVIAVHRDGAVDVPGNSFGPVARMTLPAGNWSITATATLQAVDTVNAAACELVAGKEQYQSDALPSAQGVGSYAAIVVLLAHHFAKSGAVTLNCFNGGLTGDVLIRDLHMTAVQVGQLTDSAGTFGTGSPRAFYTNDGSIRSYGSTALFDVQDISLPAGTWLVQATAWGRSAYNGDRVDCSLSSSSATADQFVEDFQGGSVSRTVGLEGVITLTSADHAFLYCKDTAAAWVVLGSAISAMKVGTLNYGPFIGTSTTTGSGTPTVVGRFSDDAGAVPTGTSPQSIGQASLGAGSWFAMAKLSVLAGATAKTTCQLQLPGAKDQSRTVLDTGNSMIDWLSMSVTRKITSSNFASLACVQSAGTNQILYLHLRMFAIKAGTLTDTVLD